MQSVEPAPGTFTTQELARLAIYRAAVAAGFYTDQLGAEDTEDIGHREDSETMTLASLPAPAGSIDSGAYPFTQEERQHLEQLKVAVADDAGRYVDDRPMAVGGAG